MKGRVTAGAILLLAASIVAAEDDIANQRHFKSSKSKAVVSIARRGVEKLFAPVGKAVHFAERIDLPNRIRDFFYNETYTAAVFPAFSFGGELGGGAVGLNAFHRDLFGRKKVLRGGFLYKDAHALRTRAAYEDPAIGSSRWRWGLKTSYVRDEEIEIYSRGDHFGIFTRSKDETRFSSDRFDGRVELGRRWERFEAGVYGRGTRSRTELGASNELVHGGGGGVQLAWDRRNNSQRPTLGTTLGARGGLMGSPDRAEDGKRYGYSEYHVEAVQFFTVFKPRRVIALRAALDRVDPLAGSTIRFDDLPLLDKNHGARNFPRGRFRDQGALAANAEYRYPIWVSWDAYLFFDAAQTFASYRQMRTNHFRYSEGFGIRFGNKDRVLFNLVVGLGREKPQIGLDFTQVF
jgi:hypothetical protein